MSASSGPGSNLCIMKGVKRQKVDACSMNLPIRDLRTGIFCDAAFRFMTLKFGLIDTYYREEYSSFAKCLTIALLSLSLYTYIYLVQCLVILRKLLLYLAIVFLKKQIHVRKDYKSTYMERYNTYHETNVPTVVDVYGNITKVTDVTHLSNP